MAKSRVRRSRDEIRKLVGEFQQSGQSQEEFADSIGVHTNTVSKWVREQRHRKSGQRQAVVPVRVKAEQPQEDLTGIELVLRNGRVIRLGRDFDGNTLNKLIELLETGC